MVLCLLAWLVLGVVQYLVVGLLVGFLYSFIGVFLYVFLYGFLHTLCLELEVAGGESFKLKCRLEAMVGVWKGWYLEVARGLFSYQRARLNLTLLEGGVA